MGAATDVRSRYPLSMAAPFLRPDRVALEAALRGVDPDLRFARAPDGATIEALLDGAVALEWGLPDDIAGSVRAVAEDAPNSFIVVLERGGRLVAACGVHVLPDLLANQGQILVDDLVVDPRSRHTGLGSTLIQGVLALARAASARRVFMALDPKNTKGRRLLEKHGLIESGDRLWAWSAN